MNLYWYFFPWARNEQTVVHADNEAQAAAVCYLTMHAIIYLLLRNSERSSIAQSRGAMKAARLLSAWCVYAVHVMRALAVNTTLWAWNVSPWCSTRRRLLTCALKRLIFGSGEQGRCFVAKMPSWRRMHPCVRTVPPITLKPLQCDSMRA